MIKLVSGLWSLVSGLWSRKKVGLVAVSLIGSQNAIGIYSG